MNDILITIIIAVLGSSGIASIVVAVLQHRWQAKQTGDARIEAIVEAQKILMVDRIRYLGRCYLSDGHISLDDKSTLIEMHKAFVALGGDGALDPLMHEVEKLEVYG